MKKTMTIAAASIALVAGADAATVIHTFGVDNNVNSPAAGVVTTSWAAIGIDGSATSYTSGAIAGTVGGEAFTYEVTVSSTGATPALNLQGTANLLGDGGTFNNGNGATIAVNVLSGNVQFDGFNSFATGSTADGEGAVVNGTSFNKLNDGIGGQGYFALGGSLEATEATFIHTSDGTTSLRWVDASFSNVAAVPEPSSTALLGLGGLALILRRRK